jgi:hypothetical protein
MWFILVPACYPLVTNRPLNISAERVRLFGRLVLRSLSGTLREILFAVTISTIKG